jgi:hypothetical protein
MYQYGSTPLPMKDYALSELGYLSCFDADPEVRRPLVSALAVAPMGYDSRNGCVPVDLHFEENVRAIAPNVGGTMNSRAMFLSVARTPAHKC